MSQFVRSHRCDRDGPIERSVQKSSWMSDTGTGESLLSEGEGYSAFRSAVDILQWHAADVPAPVPPLTKDEVQEQHVSQKACLDDAEDKRPHNDYSALHSEVDVAHRHATDAPPDVPLLPKHEAQEQNVIVEFAKFECGAPSALTSYSTTDDPASLLQKRDEGPTTEAEYSSGGQQGKFPATIEL